MEVPARRALSMGGLAWASPYSPSQFFQNIVALNHEALNLKVNLKLLEGYLSTSGFSGVEFCVEDRIQKQDLETGFEDRFFKTGFEDWI
jgi:hypothetical protein